MNRKRIVSTILTVVLAVASLTALSVVSSAPAEANSCTAVGQSTGSCTGSSNGTGGGGSYTGLSYCSGGFRYSGGVPYCYNQSVGCWVGAWNGASYNCYTNIGTKDGYKGVKYENGQFVDAITAWEIVQSITFTEPTPVAATTPRTGSDAYIGIPVWLWIANPEAFTNRNQQENAAGVDFNFQHLFEKSVWTMGDGSVVTCINAGSPYFANGSITSSPYCGYTYQTRSKNAPGGTYPVSVVTHWNVYWQASTGERDGGNPIHLTFTSDPRQLNVRELQARNTNGG